MNKREIEFIKETGLVDYLEDGVIKSIGDQIKKVIYINSEIVHLDFEEKSKFLAHMVDKGFRLRQHTSAEFIFVNKRFEDLIDKQKIPFLATGI